MKMKKTGISSFSVMLSLPILALQLSVSTANETPPINLPLVKDAQESKATSVQPKSQAAEQNKAYRLTKMAEGKVASSRIGPDVSSSFKMDSPSLLFTREQLNQLKAAVKTNSGSLHATYENLLKKSNSGLKYQPVAYTGIDSRELYYKLVGPSALIRNLAMAYVLTDDEKYARKSVEIMLEWAQKTKRINYMRYPGTSMMIARSMFPILCAYEWLEGTPALDQKSDQVIRAWFKSLAPQVKEGAAFWETNDYFDKQEYQNHLASHALGTLAFGVVLRDRDLVQFAIDSPENPRDWYDLIAGTILMKGDIPHHREGANKPPPEDGEIYDRYRHITDPAQKGLGYSMLTLSQLVLMARICENNGIDLFSYTAPGGENLLLSLEYYSDFYLLRDSCIKSKFYCSDKETARLKKGTDSPGFFELGLVHYPQSKLLQNLTYSGTYNRGEAYMDLMGYTRFFSVPIDPTN